MKYFANWCEYFLYKPFGNWAEFYEIYYGMPQSVYYTLTIGSIVIASIIAIWSYRKLDKK